MNAKIDISNKSVLLKREIFIQQSLEIFQCVHVPAYLSTEVIVNIHDSKLLDIELYVALKLPHHGIKLEGAYYGP